MPARSNLFTPVVLGTPQPTGLVNGVVLFDNGNAASGATIWAEEVLRTEPDEWNKKESTATNALPDTKTVTDADGAFAITTIKGDTRFVVKALCSGFAVSMAGPFERATLPKELVLTIKTEGARLTGQFLMRDGMPATNVTAHYYFSVQAHTLEWRKGEIRLPLTIEADGTYLSGIIAPGALSFSFDVPEHLRENRERIIRENQLETLDVVFSEIPVITGKVIDIATHMPIPDVLIMPSPEYGQQSSTCLQFSDANGLFWVRMSNEASFLRFTHILYAPSLCYVPYSPRTQYPPPVVYMSAGAQVLVNVVEADGSPATNCMVRLEANRATVIERHQESMIQSVSAGETLFSNVPVHISPVTAYACGMDGSDAAQRSFGSVYGREDANMARSEPLALTPGAVATTLLVLPPRGMLEILFSQPVKRDRIGITCRCAASNESYRAFDDHHFVFETQRAWINSMPTGFYAIDIRKSSGFRINDVTYLKTNVNIIADAPVQLYVNNASNDSGTIEGTVTVGGVPMGYFLPRAAITSSTPGERRALQYGCGYQGHFLIEGLDPQLRYDVWLSPFTISSTDIVITAVAPNGPPLSINLPAAYRITGRVVDANHQPLEWSLPYAIQDRDTGEFCLSPIFPCTFELDIRVDGYLPERRSVTVSDHDVDLGDIVMENRGLKITGTVVDENGKPLANVHIYAYGRIAQQDPNATPSWFGNDSISDEEGRFEWSGIQPNAQFSISVSTERNTKEVKTVGPFSTDTDLGAIVVTPEQK